MNKQQKLLKKIKEATKNLHELAGEYHDEFGNESLGLVVSMFVSGDEGEYDVKTAAAGNLGNLLVAIETIKKELLSKGEHPLAGIFDMLGQDCDCENCRD